MRWGILAGLMVFPLNTLLFNLHGETGWDVVFRVGGFPGTIAVVIVSGIMGFLHDTRQDRENLIQRFSTMTLELESLLLAIPDDLFRLDSTGKILDYRPSQTINLPLDSTRLLGKTLEQVFSPHLAASLQRYQNQALLTQSTLVTEFIYRLEGEERRFEARFHPLPKHELLMIIRDVTERQRVTEQQIVMEVQHNRLGFLREFIGSISHDFKTPLSIIKANLYLIERLDNPEKQRAKLAQVRQQAERLEKLLQDVIAIVRLDSDLEASQSRVDMRRLLASAVANLQHRANERRIQLILHSHNHPQVIGSELSLHQALMCLIENAINYTDEGGTIELSCQVEGDELQIRVKDTGIGIGEDDLPRIFDYFYRADKARSRETGGAGLGLPIAKRIVELHLGRISVESRLGQGSTFTMHLPLARQLEIAAAG